MLTEEERAKRAEAGRTAKAAKRQANQEAWKTHPANANAAWMQKQSELKAAVLLDVEVEDDPVGEAVNNRSLSKLRRIMGDASHPVHQRCEAASIILAYELSPASLVNVPPDQVAAASYNFLTAVADNPETPDGLRLKCLKDLAAIESARAAKPSSPEQTAASRELHVALINGARRMALIKVGCWPPPAGTQWWLSASDTFDMPALPSDPATAGMNIGQRLDHTKHLPESVRRQRRDARHAAYCAVRAQNREDRWRDLLIEAADPSA